MLVSKWNRTSIQYWNLFYWFQTSETTIAIPLVSILFQIPVCSATVLLPQQCSRLLSPHSFPLLLSQMRQLQLPAISPPLLLLLGSLGMSQLLPPPPGWVLCLRPQAGGLTQEKSTMQASINSTELGNQRDRVKAAKCPHSTRFRSRRNDISAFVNWPLCESWAQSETYF